MLSQDRASAWLCLQRLQASIEGCQNKSPEATPQRQASRQQQAAATGRGLGVKGSVLSLSIPQHSAEQHTSSHLPVVWVEGLGPRVAIGGCISLQKVAAVGQLELHLSHAGSVLQVHATLLLLL